MKNTKLLKLSLLCLVISVISGSFSAQAVTYSCVFVPTSTKIGGVGGSDGNYLYVCSGSDCYSLGAYTSEKAQMGLATAMTALASGKRVNLQYYNTTCAQVLINDDNTDAPNAIILLDS